MMNISMSVSTILLEHDILSFRGQIWQSRLMVEMESLPMAGNQMCDFECHEYSFQSTIG